MFACEGCGTPTDPTMLLISQREDRSRVCAACAADEQRESTRRGIVNQYKRGAVIVLMAILFVVIRLILRRH